MSLDRAQRVAIITEAFTDTVLSSDMRCGSMNRRNTLLLLLRMHAELIDLKATGLHCLFDELNTSSLILGWAKLKIQ